MKGFIFCSLLIYLLITGCGGGANSFSPESEKKETNTPPQIVTDQALQVLEGQLAIATLEATDKEGDALEFTLIDSADKSHFTLDSQGNLSFKAAPDYETPIDANTDNRYEITVRVSDGQLSDEANFTVQVANVLEGRLEGRVVDGPLAEAQVFVDCNSDEVRSDNEPITTTDKAGYYMFEPLSNCDSPTLISLGGRDISTNREPNLMLTAKLPDNYDLSTSVVVTPLSTVLAYANQENHKTLLKNLGIEGVASSAALLSVDPWQQTSNSTVGAKAGASLAGEIVVKIQKINAQIATLTETADALNSEGQNTRVARAIADMASQEDTTIDLSNVGTLSQIMGAVLDDKVVPDSVLEGVATINSYLASQADPTSDTVLEILSNSQQQLQNNVAKLAAKEIDDDEFKESNTEALTTIIKAPIAVPQKVEVPDTEKVVAINLAGSNADGTVAQEFLIVKLPYYGSLKTSSGDVIQSVPYKLSGEQAQISYTNTSDASDDSFIFAVIDTQADSQSAAATVAIKIIGTNNEPVALDRVATLKGGESTQITLQGSDKDGDNLKYKIVELPEFGKLMDGDKQIKQADLSYLLPQAGSSITYVNTSSTAMADSFYYVANDGKVNSKKAKVIINIEGANNIPVIESQRILSTAEDKPFEVTFDDLTVTDSDNNYPDDFTLQIGSGENYRVDGSMIIPGTNYAGDLTVPVTVSDGTHSSELFKLLIAVSAIDDAPSLSVINPISINEDQQSPATLELQGADIDSTDLIYSISGGSDDTVKASLSGQIVTFETAQDFNGSAQFTATVTADGQTDSQTFTVTVSSQNDLPTISGNPTTSIDQGEDYVFTPEAEDPDGDPLTFSIVNKPAWAFFDTQTGALTGKPGNEHVGVTQGIQISVTDNNIESPVSLAAFDLEVINVNDAPRLFEIEDIPFLEDQYNDENSYILTLQGNDIDNDETLTFSIDGGSQQTVQIEPLGDPVVNALGITQQQFAISSAEDFFDQQGIAFIATVTDNHNPPRSTSQTFTVIVNSVNDAPTIDEDDTLNAIEGQLFSFTPTVNDPDDDNNGVELTWELSAAPGDMSLVDNRGEVTWTPSDDVDKSVTFTLSVADGGEDGVAPAQRTFTISVDQQADDGEVTINGNPVVGQTLNAVVSDDDGLVDKDGELVHIDYKWERISSVMGIRAEVAKIESVGTKENYVLKSDDEGATIRVTATYTDNQGFSQQVSSETVEIVVPLPITKRTLLITDASKDDIVFNRKILHDKFDIPNLSGYTLKELSAEQLRLIAEGNLPDDNPTNRLATTKDMPILGYEHIQSFYDALPTSETFGIDDNEIIISEVPALDGQPVGTGHAIIGKSFSLAIFDQDKKLKGIANIRFAPAVVDNSAICLNPDYPSSENMDLNPVVLVHGWNTFGRAKTLNIDSFNNIAKHLNNETGATVFTTEVAPWATVEQRGEQLITYIQCVLDIEDSPGSKKYPQQVDLITHSMGGPTARYAAYWLDQHPGHVFEETDFYATKVRSVSAVAGTHYGGNVNMTSKAQLDKLYGAKAPFYQLFQIMPNLSINDILFKFIPEDDLRNQNKTLGKQYQLAIELLEKLYSEDSGLVTGLVANLQGILSESQFLMEKLVQVHPNQGVVTAWRTRREGLSGLLGAFSLYASSPPARDLCTEFNWTGLLCTRTELDDLVNDLYHQLNLLDTAANNINRVLNFLLSSEIFPEAKKGISLITAELKALRDIDEYEPDYHAIVDAIATIQKAVSDASEGTYQGEAVLLSEFPDYINDIATALRGLEIVFKNYPDIAPALISFLASWRSVIGISAEQVGDLEAAVRDLGSILSSPNAHNHTMYSLSQRVEDIDISSELKKLIFGDQQDIDDFVDLVADLATDGEYVLREFRSRIETHRGKLYTITDLRICDNFFTYGNCKDTSLRGLSVALTYMDRDLGKTLDTLDDVRTIFRGTSGKSEGDWEDLIDWEFEEIEKIKTELLTTFLTSNAAGKHGVDPNLVNDCLIDNEVFDAYLEQEFNKDADDTVRLPNQVFLSRDCAGVINSLVDAALEHLIPIEEPNPKTGEFPHDEIRSGLYGIGQFGAQMFNLKYPDTGITLGNFKRCIDQERPDDYLFDTRTGTGITDGFNQNRQGKTKYNSWVNQRDWQEGTWSDRLLVNLMVPTNNPRVTDEINGIYKRFTDLTALFMIQRNPAWAIEEEQNDQEIDELMEHTDFLVHICSQELGQVVGLSDLNHAQSTNINIRLTEADDFFELIMGESIGAGNTSIASEMLGCNQSGDLVTRNTCFADLFPRLLIMYGIYKAKTGLEDMDEDGRLDIFDLLLGVLADQVEMGEVYSRPDSDRYVPKIYSDLIKEASSP